MPFFNLKERKRETFNSKGCLQFSKKELLVTFVKKTQYKSDSGEVKCSQTICEPPLALHFEPLIWLLRNQGVNQIAEHSWADSIDCRHTAATSHWPVTLSHRSFEEPTAEYPPQESTKILIPHLLTTRQTNKK